MKTTTLPSTRRDNVTETLHGVELTDPYHWLEDQDSSETRSWLDEQIAYTHKTLAGYPDRRKIRDRLAELMKVDSTSQPLSRNGSYYFLRRRADEQQYIIYRRRSLDGPDEPLIDPHIMSADHTSSVGLLDVSHDGCLIAYGVRQGGADEVVIHLRDSTTLEDLPDTLPAALYFGVNITCDNRAFYYSVNTAAGPRVRLHRLGARLEADQEIFGAGLGPDKIGGIGLSEDGKYLLITVYHGSASIKTDLYIADLLAKTPVRPVVDNILARFSAQVAGDDLYMQTNWNAPNGRVFRLNANASSNSPDSWKEIVPERPDAILQECALVGGKLFLNYLENVTSSVVIADANGTLLSQAPLPGLGAVSGPIGSWTNPDIFFSFSSFAIPPAIYRYNQKTAVCELWASSGVVFEPESIEVRQVWYASKDGAKVPMFLVHAKNLKMDGERPVYMTGYGGFNLSRTPAFSALAVVWAEQGGIFALPNLRGGGEFGQEWHKAGMLNQKQNVFNDFYAAAEWLINTGCTRAAKLGIAGRSNGGLLVGAAITQRPELFGAVVCGYPLLDMIRYHKFLVAGYWVPEYGSSDDPDQFPFLYAYSPYHHVVPGVKYPAIMFVTGDSDTRVAPLHARKMAALMQANSSPDRPVLLHYDLKSGHSDGKPIDQTVEDTTDEALFLLSNMGV